MPELYPSANFEALQSWNSPVGMPQLRIGHKTHYPMGRCIHLVFDIGPRLSIPLGAGAGAAVYSDDGVHTGKQFDSLA